MKLYSKRFDTPYGPMMIAVDDNGALNRLVFPNEHDRWAAEVIARQHDISDNIVRTEALCAPSLDQLAEYFAGVRQIFDMAVAPHGTPFQLSVWQTLRTIPYGKTITYAQLALRIGNPAAIRAVGHANGANPIPIVLPCHRVIGSNGQLVGFGGGLPLKAALLTLEGALAPLQTKFDLS